MLLPFFFFSGHGWAPLVEVPATPGLSGQVEVAADMVSRWRHGCVAGVRHADQWRRGQHRCRAVGCRAVSRAVSGKPTASVNRDRPLRSLVASLRITTFIIAPPPQERKQQSSMMGASTLQA